MKRHLISFPAFCLLALQAAAQPSVKGIVTETEGDPVPYATVTLLHDARQVAGTTSGPDGRFTIAAAKGRYRLAVRCLGYAAVEEEVEAVDSAQAEVTIRLTPLATGIGEVVVRTGGIERRADRFVVEVGGDAAVGKDGAEILSQAPGVWLDDERLSVNGAGGTKVYIDDREVRLEGEKLTAYLRTLRAEEIRRVEVIPQAGAEYAADTRGGVIRITLRKRLDDGMSGSVAAAMRQGGRLSAYAPSANVSAHRGGWTIGASGSGSFTTRGETELLETRTYPDPTTRFVSPSLTRMRQNYGTGRLSPVTASSELVRQAVVPRTSSSYGQRGDEKIFSATVNYIYRPDTLGTTLKIIADYMHRTSSADNDYLTRRLSGAGAPSDTLYRNSSFARNDIFTADAAFDKPLGRGMRIRTGVRYTYTRTNDTARYEAFDGAWQPRPESDRRLDYTEHIGGLYGIFSAEVGRWSFTAGLRGELARTAGRGGEVRRTYADLFPNAGITYAFDAMRNWMLAAQYSRNIERPGFPALNPARIQISDYSYMVGNPDLKPTYIHRFSLTLIYRYRFTLTVGGNLHRDLIREERRIDPTSPDISYVMPENHYTEDHWFVALNAPFRIAKWWSLTVNFVGVKQDIRMAEHAAPATHDLYFAGVVSGFSLPAGFHIELSWNGTSRLWSGNCAVDPRNTFSAAVKKRLAGDRLTLAASVQNLFDARSGYSSFTDGFDSATAGREARQSRHVRLSVAWNFRTGGKFRERRIESASDTEKARLKKLSAQ